MSSNQVVLSGDSLSSQSLEQMSGMVKRQTIRESEQIVKRTIVANVHEQGRAYLTNTALQNVGALSALEAHLIEIAPLGAARYEHIVNAYAMGAAQAVARW